MAAVILRTNQRPVFSLVDQSAFRTLDTDGQREVRVTWPAVTAQTIEISVVRAILSSDWSFCKIQGSHWLLLVNDGYAAFQADTLHTNWRRDTSFSISGCLSWSIFKTVFKVNVCSILTLGVNIRAGGKMMTSAAFWRNENKQSWVHICAHFVERGDNIPWKL